VTSVLLHGFTGSPQSVVAMADCAPMPCWSPTLPGHCGTDCGADFFDTADRVARQVENAGHAGAQVVAYSLGARIALSLLVDRPELFSSAILIGCHFGLRSLEARRQRRDRDRTWIELLRRDGIKTFVQRWESLPIFSTQSPELRAAQRPVRSSHAAAGLARSLETAGLAEMPSYWPKLAAIEIPVELLTGELDGKFSALAREAVSHNVRIAHRVVSGVGHNVAAEEPKSVWR